MKEKQNNKTALTFVNGEVTAREIEIVKTRSFNQVIAADGGTHHALKWGFSPHIVVGDLDSITPQIRNSLPDTQFVHRPSQELNDLEKTLQYCQQAGFTHLILVGISGKRLDHTLNNLSVLARYDTQFHLEIYDAYSRIYFVRHAFTIQGEPGQLVSLIPVGRVEGIVTKGLAFPLRNEPLEFGVREGLSNYLTQSIAHITLQKGLLLVFVHYKEPYR